MKKTAIFPGSFDPITNGHLDIIRRAAKLADELIVAVLVNGEKTPLFSDIERVNMIKEVTKDIPNVKADCFSGMLVDYAGKMNASYIVRGLRNTADFDYENQIALLNRALCPELETIYFPADPALTYISSSYTKEVASYNGDLSSFVPEFIKNKLSEKFKERKK